MTLYVLSNLGFIFSSGKRQMMMLVDVAGWSRDSGLLDLIKPILEERQVGMIDQGTMLLISELHRN